MTEPIATDPQSCERCGDFSPLNLHLGRRWCRTCLSRRDPIELEPPTIGNLIKHSVALALGIGAPAALIAVLIATTQHVLPNTGSWSSTALSFVHSATLGLFGRAVLQRLAFLSVVQPQRATLEHALRDAWHRSSAAFGQFMLGGLEIVLWSLLLLIPGMVRFLDFEMSLSLTVNEGMNAREALKTSLGRMLGHRGATFVAYWPLMIPVLAMFAGVVAESIVRTNRGLPLTAEFSWWHTTVTTLVVPILSVPAELLGVVLHLKLAQPQGVRPSQVEPLPGAEPQRAL